MDGYPWCQELALATVLMAQEEVKTIGCDPHPGTGDGYTFEDLSLMTCFCLPGLVRRAPQPLKQCYQAGNKHPKQEPVGKFLIQAIATPLLAS